MGPSRDEVEAMVIALFTMNAGLDRARRRSKGASALSLLQLLAAGQQLRPSDIAEQLSVHPSLVTRQVRELEDCGYVTVEPDPGDARSVLISVSKAGTQEQERLLQIGLERFALFVADWEPEEVRTLTSLLEKLERSKAAIGAKERREPNTPHRPSRRRQPRATKPGQDLSNPPGCRFLPPQPP
jgi:DNA-binding MarR family transcriptional regulator